MESTAVSGHWKTSMNVGSLVTLVAAVHYFYMREFWVQIGSSPIVYRYIDWSITVPLQMVEFYLILSAVQPNITAGMFWRLLLGTVAMLAFGYAGEAGFINAGAGFVFGMAGWGYILFEIFMGEAGSVAATGENVNKHVKDSFSTMRFIVTVGWSIYPIGYFFGYLMGSVRASDLNLVYNLADFVNKIGFCLAIWNSAKTSTLEKHVIAELQDAQAAAANAEDFAEASRLKAAIGSIKYGGGSMAVAVSGAGVVNNDMVKTTSDWSALQAKLAAGGSAADGAAAKFSQDARVEAARKLITNRDRVLNDVCNPARKSQPIPLKEVVSQSHKSAAENGMKETARRLLGQPSSENRHSAEDQKAWVDMAKIIDARLQTSSAQCPTRVRDMGEEAGAALRAVLKEVCGEEFPSRVVSKRL